MVFPTSTPRTHLPGRSPAPCAGLRPRKQDTKTLKANYNKTLQPIKQ
jgi:hypothetical protein